MIIRESMTDPSLSSLTEKLLIRYIHLLRHHAEQALSAGQYKNGRQEQNIQGVAQSYMPSARVWAAAFEIYSPRTSSGADRTSNFDAAETARTLRAIYDKWRLKSPAEYGEAALAWAGWLVRAGSGREAGDVIARARAAIDDGHKIDFERRWRELLDTTDGDGESETEAEDEIQVETMGA